MTDRFVALTVVLEQPTRDDDAAPIIAAVKQLRGVLSVTPIVADAMQYAAEQRARFALFEKIIEIVKPQG
jgi:hypothetical protein